MNDPFDPEPAKTRAPGQFTPLHLGVTVAVVWVTVEIVSYAARAARKKK